MSARPAIFLDRDGTIIVDQHYPRDPEKVAFLPNAVEGLKLMMNKGYWLFIVSNQSGVGRGIIQNDEFNAVHRRFSELLEKEKITIAQFIYCLHRPEDDCNCRKPKTGQIPKAFAGSPIDLKGSFTIGDRESDLELGDALGAKAILVPTGKGENTLTELRATGRDKAYLHCHDLLAAAKLIPPFQG